jgi:hypothetical protein
MFAAKIARNEILKHRRRELDQIDILRLPSRIARHDARLNGPAHISSSQRQRLTMHCMRTA